MPDDNIKSEWDARQEFFDLWKKDQDTLSIYKDPDFIAIHGEAPAINIVRNNLIRMSPYTNIDPVEVQIKFRALTEKKQRLGNYDGLAWAEAQRKVTHEIIDLITKIEVDLMQCMSEKSMLLPHFIKIDKDDPEVVANNFEKHAYRGLSSDDNKIIPAMRNFKGYNLCDKQLMAVIERQRWIIETKKQDGFWLVWGDTGGGKSNFAIVAQYLYTNGRMDVNRLGFDNQHYAGILHDNLKNEDVSLRFTHFDEANVSARDGMSSWNRDLIDLFDAIRGMQGFHMWCNPSAQYLEKRFVQERVHALVYIHGGTSEFRREYSMIGKAKILELIEKHGSLKVSDNVIRDYSFVDGWVKPYPKDDPFNVAYLAAKDERMRKKLRTFDLKHGSGKTIQIPDIALELGMTYPSVKKALCDLIADGKIMEDEIKTPNNRYYLNEAHKNMIIEKLKNKPRWKQSASASESVAPAPAPQPPNLTPA